MLDIKQHEKALRAINERILKGENVDVQKELSALLGENTFAYKLKAFLTKGVNARISYKMKERYNNARMYFELRERIRENIINSTNWVSWFENEISIQELESFDKDPSSFDPKTLMLVVIEALKQYSDLVGEERNVKYSSLHRLYLSLKEKLSSSVPFESEDGFVEYLSLKQHRTDLENARLTGSICPFCESKDVRSYGLNWKCGNCNREFRKHQAKKEDD
jgi:hypothetical protein